MVCGISAETLIRVLDEVSDCVPLLSSVTNITQIAWTALREKNDNPQASGPMVDNVKIYTLSKNKFASAIFAIPILGNLAAIGYHLSNALAAAFDVKLGDERNHLLRAIVDPGLGLKGSRIEVAKLYLKNHPCTKESLERPLHLASSFDCDIFKTLVNSLEDPWTKELSTSVFNIAQKGLKTKIHPDLLIDILQKTPEPRSGPEKRQLLANLSLDRVGINQPNLVKYLIDGLRCTDKSENSHRNMRALHNALRQAVNNGATESVLLLLNHLNSNNALTDDTPVSNPLNLDLVSDQLNLTLQLALMNKKQKTDNADAILDLLIQALPEKTRADTVFPVAAKQGNIEIVEKFLNDPELKSSAIGKALAEVVTTHYFESDGFVPILNLIVSNFPDLPVKDLKEAMINAALHNDKVFELFLTHFKNLTEESLQEIYDGVAMYEEERFSSEDDKWQKASIKRGKAVAGKIKAKFPDIKKSQT